MCGILMLVSVLASGSKGNSTYVKTSHHELLIDAGCTMNYLNEKLIENNTDRIKNYRTNMRKDVKSHFWLQCNNYIREIEEIFQNLVIII